MGVRVDPQRGSAELSGGHLPLAGGQTSLIPVKYSPAFVCCLRTVLLSYRLISPARQQMFYTDNRNKGSDVANMAAH